MSITIHPQNPFSSVLFDGRIKSYSSYSFAYFRWFCRRPRSFRNESISDCSLEVRHSSIPKDFRQQEKRRQIECLDDGSRHNSVPRESTNSRGLRPECFVYQSVIKNRTYNDRLHLQNRLRWFAFDGEFASLQCLYGQVHLLLVPFQQDLASIVLSLIYFHKVYKKTLSIQSRGNLVL